MEAEAVLHELERAADAISARLARSDDERASKALRSWARRDDVSTTELVSIATGLSRELVVEAAGEQVERVGALPHEEGIEAARWLRQRLGLQRDPLSPRDLLATWGVTVESFTTLPAIDAICAWGARHGPAILLNPRGRRARGPQGERSTLAHEIAHLLLDRDGALPVAEVLGGRVPRGVEQRAGAFAAELLLPQEVVRDEIAGGSAIRSVVRSLKKRFGVSEELIAWQARNGNAPLTDEDRWYLRSLVSEPQRY